MLVLGVVDDPILCDLLGYSFIISSRDGIYRGISGPGLVCGAVNAEKSQVVRCIQPNDRLKLGANDKEFLW